MKKQAYIQSQKGIAIMLVLVFSGVFIIAVSSLMGFILVQAQLGGDAQTRAQALGIAEGGLEYYNWFLTHYPNNIQDGTGVGGPYVHDYTDPQTGEKVGTFSLDITGNKVCGQLQSIAVTSTGTVTTDPRFKRTILGKHATPSVAKYSYIIGENVWAGSDRKITGPYHSNGGIRMDGTNNSLVTSAVSNWTCTGSFGCSSAQTKNGIFGTGSGNLLWKYPTPKIDFNTLTPNFLDLKQYAQSSGIYLPPFGATTQNFNGYQVAQDGYHLIFNADGTVDIYQVTSTWGYWGYLSGIGWTPDFHIIYSESFIERRAVPTGCSLIFVEDKTWIEGTIQGKITVVVADVTNGNYKPNVILPGDIKYSTQNGSDGLTIISQNGIYIPPLSPNNLSLHGIFVAEGDRFGRPHYPGDIKNKLTIKGSIISKKRVGTKWSCVGVPLCSGYITRVNAYDRLQVTNPPPFTPATTSTPQYVLWHEK